MDDHERSHYATARRQPLLTVKELAHELQVSDSTVRRLVASGALPVVRVGRVIRFAPDAVDELIGTSTEPGATGRQPRKDARCQSR